MGSSVSAEVTRSSRISAGPSVPRKGDRAPAALSDACAGAIERARDFVLSALEIDQRDLLAGLVFGSRAGGGSAANDVDLIFLIAELSDRPAFSYRQLHDGSNPIDCNIVKPSFLNRLCQRDACWSYRLYRARPIGRDIDPALERWLARINRLAESGPACRHRALLHIRDARSLLREATRLAGSEPGLAKYFLAEAIFWLPVIYLNLAGVVPFEGGQPWDEAARVASMSDTAISRSYTQLSNSLLMSAVFCRDGDPRPFARQLKDLKTACTKISLHHGSDLLGNGYGTRVAEAFRANPAMASEIVRQISVVSEAALSLVPQIWTWLSAAASFHSHGKTARRVKQRRKRDRTSGIRHIEYNSATKILKAIVPTGGCRVPTCTFCMLPSLARPKTDIEDVVASLKAEQRGPIQRISIYTDGSFFDDRELTRPERLRLASTARELGTAELLVESLPRFLTRAAVEEVKQTLGAACRLRIAVGMQSSDALVRRYVTSTPISQRELAALLRWREEGTFAMRIYLLANKPLLTKSEDRLDLSRSLRFLDQWLGAADIVTVNPLLPTNFTLLDKLSSRGFWRALSLEETNDLETELRSEKYAFELEFGPAIASTCQDLDLQKAPDAVNLRQTSATTDLPWSILGSAGYRYRWAVGNLD
jgi:radical SAM enzyme (TIGR01210 family)